MKSGTLELVNLVKRSRKKPKIDIQVFADFVADLQEYGSDTLLNHIQARLEAPLKASTERRVPSQLEVYFLGSQQKTDLSRRQFIDQVIVILKEKFQAPNLIASKRTLPKFLNFYKSRLELEQIQQAILEVAREHSRSA